MNNKHSTKIKETPADTNTHTQREENEKMKQIGKLCSNKNKKHFNQYKNISGDLNPIRNGAFRLKKKKNHKIYGNLVQINITHFAFAK